MARRFRFPLQKLLSVREQQQRLAEGRLGEAVAALTQLAADREALLQQLAGLGDALPTTQVGWQARLSGIDGLRRAVADCDARTPELLTAVEQARTTVRDAEIACEALRTLRDKQLAAHRLAEQRARQVEADERALAVWDGGAAASKARRAADHDQADNATLWTKQGPAT